MQDESRLFALKKAYWETEVPPEMEEKMNQAIESAKKSKANRPMRIFRTVGTTAAAFVAAVAVLFTGLTGTAFAPLMVKLFRIKNPVAQGLGIGACSHGSGTSRAIQMGEIQGAMSGVAISLCGISTSILALFL